MVGSPVPFELGVNQTAYSEAGTGAVTTTGSFFSNRTPANELGSQNQVLGAEFSTGRNGLILVVAALIALIIMKKGRR